MTMQIDWLRGCATAMVTPFTGTGEIDETRLRQLIERQIAGGVRLLVPCGTTGESATLTEAEDRRVIELTIEAARGRARIIAGTGSNSTADAVEYTRAARELGADAALVVAPYYNKPTQEGLYAHFRAIAEAVPDFPIVLYNVPGRTSSNISATTVLRLARETHIIVAIKEAEGFSVLSGDDALTLPLIAAGADGVVSVASNEVPDLMARLTELCLAGEWSEARALHYRLLPLMQANFIESSPGPVKAALALLGLIEENFRLPLVPVQEATRARLRAILIELGLLREAANAAA